MISDPYPIFNTLCFCHFKRNGRFRKVFSAPVLMIILFAFLAQKEASGQKKTLIENDRFNISISTGDGLLAFEDSTGSLTIHDVVDSELFNQGLNGPNSPTGVYWVKVTLMNTTPYDMDVVATQPRSIETILYKQEGEVFFRALFGAFQKKSDLNKGDSRSHVSFKLKAGLPNDIYFKVSGRSFTATFVDSKTFVAAQSRSQLQDFLFFGACAILIIYTLVQFLIYRKISYLWLLMFTLGTGMYAFCIRGYFIDWLMPEMPKTGLNFSFVWSQVGQLGAILLAIDFLQLKSKFPAWYKVFLGLILLLVFRTSYGVYLTAVLDDYGTMTNMGLFTLLFDIAAYTVLLFSVWKKVNVSRKVFLCGLILFGLGLIIVIVIWKSSLITDYRLFLLYTGSLCSLAQVLIFSIALGIELRQHEVDKNIALDDLNTALKDQNQKVEMEVVERTREVNLQKEQLQDRNEKIETLFKEIHHRVKNNLQMISSLLNMQQDFVGDDSSSRALADSRSRVSAMSIIHQFLYKTDDIDQLDFKEYIEELSAKIDELYGGKVSIQLLMNFDKDYSYDLDTSISLGLILNELFTNAYKYAASEDQELMIKINLNEQHQGYYQLDFIDNGDAMKAPFSELVNKGFGLRLSSRLARQLQGTFSYEYDHGNKFSIIFASMETRMALADD
ncbi:MAG: hypothetical protein COW03_07770 [Cytophagales bacterium CG12_big_fil_rev_8_21_14_0_65_40_12]|nr:MAG: hypothetical protein COW03_07770 [Cytophagales bacterium CG12_big_fil_rev_8_21_14_0_65_40_12]PIW05733.1 MAG: hypothetical protein COW40_03045 [Cytophagales bacterium CG17_big_fil_post_rev_8_21_14_2_50_40_13]